jgi:hypothetical protein
MDVTDMSATLGNTKLTYNNNNSNHQQCHLSPDSHPYPTKNKFLPFIIHLMAIILFLNNPHILIPIVLYAIINMTMHSMTLPIALSNIQSTLLTRTHMNV